MPTTRPDWLPVEQYPFEIRAMDLSGTPISYVDEGEGPVLLFVHAGMWSFVFRDAIDRLRSDFRCVTLDFPGFGLSPAADPDLELRDFVSLLDEFVHSLDLTDMTVVVHDLGGPVGLLAAAGMPKRISGLVLAQTFAWTPDSRGLRTMFRIVGGRTLTAIDVATNVIPKLSSGGAGVGRNLDQDGKRAFLGPYREKGPRRRFHTTMRSAFRDPELTDSVERATKTVLNDLPVLTIFGEKNDPFHFQDRHAKTFPHHQGVVVEKGNHFPMMDDPDLFANSIREWHKASVRRSIAA